MGSSAQISSGMCRRGSQEQVPEEGPGRLRGVPACAGVGFWKVPESSGLCWCRFRRRVPEGSRVPAYGSVGSGGGFRKVPESCGVWWCRRQGSEFRRGKFDRSSHVIVLNTGW